MTAVARGNRPHESSVSATDMNDRWWLRCILEEQVEDLKAVLRRSEPQRRELSADYKHVLGQLWKANAGIGRRERT